MTHGPLRGLSLENDNTYKGGEQQARPAAANPFLFYENAFREDCPTERGSPSVQFEVTPCFVTYIIVTYIKLHHSGKVVTIPATVAVIHKHQAYLHTM